MRGGFRRLGVVAVRRVVGDEAEVVRRVGGRRVGGHVGLAGGDGVLPAVRGTEHQPAGAHVLRVAGVGLHQAVDDRHGLVGLARGHELGDDLLAQRGVGRIRAHEADERLQRLLLVVLRLVHVVLEAQRHRAVRIDLGDGVRHGEDRVLPRLGGRVRTHLPRLVRVGEAEARDGGTLIGADPLAGRGGRDVDLLAAQPVLALLHGRDLLARVLVLADDLLGHVAEVAALDGDQGLRQGDVARQEEPRAHAVACPGPADLAVDHLVAADELRELLDVVRVEGRVRPVARGDQRVVDVLLGHRHQLADVEVGLNAVADLVGELDAGLGIAAERRDDGPLRVRSWRLRPHLGTEG